MEILFLICLHPPVVKIIFLLFIIENISYITDELIYYYLDFTKEYEVARFFLFEALDFDNHCVLYFRDDLYRSQDSFRLFYF